MLSNVGFCMMVCLVRYQTSASSYMTTFCRFAVGLSVIGLLALSGKQKLTFVNNKSLLFRGLAGGVATAVNFWAINKLGIIRSSIILSTYPIFGSVISVFMLNEKLTIQRCLALIFAFFGVVLVLSKGNGFSGLVYGFGTAELIALGGAVLAGLSVVFVKQLQATDNSVTIFFAQCLIGFWLVVIPAGAMPLSIGWTGSIILVLIGLLAAAGQLCMTEGYRYINVSTASMCVMFAPVFNMIAAVALFHEKISAMMCIGSSIVVLSSLSTLKFDKMKAGKLFHGAILDN